MKALSILLVLSLLATLVGCTSTEPPPPTDEGKKAVMGRKPTPEELAESQKRAEEAMQKHFKEKGISPNVK